MKLFYTKEIKDVRLTNSYSKIAVIRDLPAGLRCRQKYTANGIIYFLDEFPETLFPKNSLELHDALHTGIEIKKENLEMRNI